MQTSLWPNRLSFVLWLPNPKGVDELNLAKKVVSCHPSNLSLPDHVNPFVALDHSPAPGILGSPVWGSLGAWLADPVPECCSSTAQVAADSACVALLPSHYRESRSCRSPPGWC